MSHFDKESGRAGNSGAPEGEELGMGSFGTDSDSSQSDFPAPSFRPKELDHYEGFELIPLNPPDAQDRNGRSIGKAPTKGWRVNPALSIDDAKAHMQSHGNVGVRLRATELVVDVDPRNFADGDDPLKRLGKDRGIDWSLYPEVKTGSGGSHYYMSKPADVTLCNSVTGYDGLEFKSLGKQVVAAGSVHPITGEPYLWDDDPLAVTLSELPAAPDSLIAFALKPPLPINADPGGGRTPEDLEAMLAGLDPCCYRDHERWLRLMMACHHATGGDGRDEFIAWSTADPTYRDQGAVIGQRWDSLHADGDGKQVTEKTLFKELIDAGRSDLVPRISAEDDFPDDLPPATIVNGSKLRRGGVVDEWVYVIDAEQFVRRVDGKKWKKEQWKAKYASLKPDGDVLSAIWRGAVPIRKFEALVYLPGAPEFPGGENGDTYNIWRESGVDAKPGDVEPFLDHMAYLFDDETERGYVLDYLAMLVQRPDQKVNYALLVKGGQGTGKSWLGRLMTAIIGQRNVTLPSNGEVMSQWTVWTEGAQLGIIEELMAVGRLDMANRLKPIITEPSLRIESKGCSLYSIPNKLNLIAFTNHDDAVPIERGDRRWLVVFSNAKPLAEAYYETLFRFLDRDGPAAVKDWLLKRDVTLNPKGMAPRTSGKDEMRRLSMGEAEQFLSELMEAGDAPFDFPLVRFEDVQSAVPFDIAKRSKGLRSQVTNWLNREAGAVRHTRYKKQDGSNRQNSALWSIRDHDHWLNKGPAARIDEYTAHRKETGPFEE